MLTYLYLDYGGHAKYRRELKYSLISLQAELGRAQADIQTGVQADARIAVYTDAPPTYDRWPVTAVGIADRIKPWSGNGLYHHRIKPEVVRDALTRFAGPVCLLDCDSIVRPGFHAEVTAKLAPTAKGSCGVVMNVFEKRNPFPPLSGFRCRLPHLGDYRYDAAASLMYNSGLIGMRPEQGRVLDDALAMIDALIGRAKKFPTIEQFALSEVLRLNGIAIAEVNQSFLHYWQGRRRIYMQAQIEKRPWRRLGRPHAAESLGGNEQLGDPRL
jgi:hypothetical protein